MLLYTNMFGIIPPFLFFFQFIVCSKKLMAPKTHTYFSCIRTYANQQDKTKKKLSRNLFMFIYVTLFVILPAVSIMQTFYFITYLLVLGSILCTIEITAFACNMPVFACCMPCHSNWWHCNKASLLLLYIDQLKIYFIIFGLLPHL